MWKKALVYLSVIIVAFAILFASILRTASVKFEVNDISPDRGFIPLDECLDEVVIDYYLPYPGRVLPDNPLWPIKALRDRLWFSITTNLTRKVELKLLFADKRLGSSQILFQKGKIEDAISTLTKAEKYLQEASLDEEVLRKEGYDTTELLYRLTNASLKHYQVMNAFKKIVAPDVIQLILELQEYPKKSYEQGKNGLLDKGIMPPENPFEW
jgi:hypothetical protein